MFHIITLSPAGALISYHNTAGTAANHCGAAHDGDIGRKIAAMEPGALISIVSRDGVNTYYAHRFLEAE